MAGYAGAMGWPGVIWPPPAAVGLGKVWPLFREAKRLFLPMSWLLSPPAASLCSGGAPVLLTTVRFLLHWGFIQVGLATLRDSRWGGDWTR